MVDTSKEFCEMCEQAFKEIGELETRHFACGNIPKLWAIRNGPSYNPFNFLPQKERPEGERWFQVYYQDQLQEMVERVKDKNHFLFRFYHFLQTKYIKATRQSSYVVLENMFDNGTSMEQLWLAFVMKEKYGKIWNGKEWAKEEP